METEMLGHESGLEVWWVSNSQYILETVFFSYASAPHYNNLKGYTIIISMDN